MEVSLSYSWRLRRPSGRTGFAESRNRARGTDCSASFPTGTPLAAISLEDHLRLRMEAGEKAQSSPTETEFPLRRPSKVVNSRTVLAGKGPLRRANARPCPLRAVRLAVAFATGGS